MRAPGERHFDYFVVVSLEETGSNYDRITTELGAILGTLKHGAQL